VKRDNVYYLIAAVAVEKLDPSFGGSGAGAERIVEV
jgi:hypothetical protein